MADKKEAMVSGLKAPPFQNRKLTSMERISLHIARAANWLFVVYCRLKGEVQVSRLEAALKQVARRHFYLNVAVRFRSPATWIYKEDMALAFRVEEGLNREEFSERELSLPLDLEKGPLYRFSLLKQKGGDVLVGTFSHVIADGLSGMAILQEAIEAYCGSDMPLEAAQPVFPSFSLFPENCRGFRGFFKQIAYLGGFIKDNLSLSRKNTPREKEVPLLNRAPLILSGGLGVDETARLIRSCREHGITVQGALCAAFTQALGEKILSETRIPVPVVETLSVVNLRPFLAVPLDNRIPGMWAGQVSRFRKFRKDEPFFVLAKGFHQAIIEEKKRTGFFTPFHILRKALFLPPEAYINLLVHTNCNVEMSNLGVIPSPNCSGGIEVEDVGFSVGIADSQSFKWGLTVNAATFRGELQANLIVLKECWSRKEAAALLKTALEKLLNPESSG